MDGRTMPICKYPHFYGANDFLTFEINKYEL